MTPESEARRRYKGFAPLGIPYSSEDVDMAADHMVKVAWKSDDPTASMRYILANNESVVNRCGMLMTFSGVIIAISLFIAVSPSRFVTTGWQRTELYISISLWALSTIMLLFSLRHKLPEPWEFHTKEDFKFTARLYVRRLGFTTYSL